MGRTQVFLTVEEKKKVVNEIKANAHITGIIRKVAKDFGVSTTHISRVFFELEGVNLVQYRAQNKIVGTKIGTANEMLTFIENNKHMPRVLNIASKKFGYNRGHVSQLFVRKHRINFEQWLVKNG